MSYNNTIDCILLQSGAFMMKPGNPPPDISVVIELDRKLRADITRYYFALQKMNDPAKSIELLAGHVAIMVEMINEFKKNG